MAKFSPYRDAFAAPTALLSGPDDAARPLQMHPEMTAGVAGARLVVVPHAGRFVRPERPAAAADAGLDGRVEVDAKAFDLSEVTRDSRSRS